MHTTVSENVCFEVAHQAPNTTLLNPLILALVRGFCLISFFLTLFYLYFQAYVWENNVYIKTSPESPSQQVTFSKHNDVYNGIPDWVYEEEMFSSNHALWWSPGGKYVAYAEFNDTEVHTIEYSWYGDSQYPSTVLIPYPKAGTPNPVVKLFVVDSENVTKTAEVLAPDPFKTVDHYLATVTWATDNRLAVQWLKRVQNHLILQIYNFSGSSWDPVEVNSSKLLTSSGWIGRFSPSEPVFAADANSYYLVMSDGNKYKHIHQVGRTTCLTCTLPAHCEYNSASFSHNASFYLLSCNGKLTQDSLSFTHHKGVIFVFLVFLWTDLWYTMLLPPGFDESKTYPLLIDVYAGPCSQKVDLRYRVGWSTYLASTEKIIVASFDGRGSGYQGDELMHEIYKRLGTYEVEDQITAAREFVKMGFIDKNRIAIWGWSYGGYVTSMVLGSGSGVFKCGMAVAPVSKWTYYDSIYTERYMMQPSENPKGYANSTVTARAKNFHSVQYLLVHGTADDNVHFQQAAEISEALVDEQVDFEAMWYTDKDHGLSGSANSHVYTHLSHFLKRCFA
uniref:Dipeptidyl-peptidase 4 n=1 Tax=Oryzias sinensis TaxID=183150 RepID=A0A8C8A1V1_9TELE